MTPITRQLIIALTVAFVSVSGAGALSGDVAKVLTELENGWVEALVKADTAKLDAILVDTYIDTDEGGHQSDKGATLAVLKSGDLKCMPTAMRRRGGRPRPLGPPRQNEITSRLI